MDTHGTGGYARHRRVRTAPADAQSISGCSRHRGTRTAQGDGDPHGEDGPGGHARHQRPRRRQGLPTRPEGNTDALPDRLAVHPHYVDRDKAGRDWAPPGLVHPSADALRVHRFSLTAVPEPARSPRIKPVHGIHIAPAAHAPSLLCQPDSHAGCWLLQRTIKSHDQQPRPLKGTVWNGSLDLLLFLTAPGLGSLTVTRTSPHRYSHELAWPTALGPSLVYCNPG